MGQREQERVRGKRREDRHERSDAVHSGGGEWDCIRLPEGLEVFKPEKDKTYHIDIIPYVVGKHNRAADPGDEYFELSYPVYRDLGIDEKKYIAIGELKGMKDPVAEHFAKLKKDGAEWDDMKIYRPSERTLFLFFVHEQADKGLQLFEGAFGTFFEQLKKEIKDLDESWADNLDDPDGGATVKARFEAKSIGQANPWVKVDKMNLEKREGGFTAGGNKKLADKILAQAATICLDDCLKIPTYDQLKKALDGEPETEGDEPEKPKATGSTKPKPPPVDDDDEEPKPRGKGTGKDDDTDEPEEKPKGGGKATKDDDDEEEEAPPKKGKPTAADLDITKGGTVHHDEHGKCTVLNISEDGLTVKLLDKNDDVHKGISVQDVDPIATKPKDDDTEDEEPKKAGASSKGDATGKTSASTAEKSSAKTGSASPSDKGKKKDDDWDEDWEDEPKKDEKKKK